MNNDQNKKISLSESVGQTISNLYSKPVETVSHPKLTQDQAMLLIRAELFGNA